jgi:uncharacterized peroxidase-related enzyme
MTLLRALPANATLADLRLRYPDLLEKLRPYADRLMRGPSPLTPGQRELIAAFVSGVNSCRYCHGAHARVAQAFGIDETVLAAALDDLERAAIDRSLKPLLRYVRKLTETPSRMTEADASAVYAAGWNDDALLHAIAVCAYFNNMNRLVDGTGIVGTPEAYAVAARQLAAHGYSARGAGRARSPQRHKPRRRPSRPRAKRT